MLVVSDVDDVFLPKPTDLLVNLAEAKASLEALLGRINEMFQDNHTVGSALGPALQAGFKLMVCMRAIWGLSSPNGSAGSDWWENHRVVCFPTQCWCWRTQKPRRSQDSRYLQGTSPDPTGV